MSTITEHIFNSLKENGFDISLLELEKILAVLVEKDFIQREMPSVLENEGVHRTDGDCKYRYRFVVIKE
jgi:hypothetical protein